MKIPLKSFFGATLLVAAVVYCLKRSFDITYHENMTCMLIQRMSSLTDEGSNGCIVYFYKDNINSTTIYNRAYKYFYNDLCVDHATVINYGSHSKNMLVLEYVSSCDLILGLNLISCNLTHEDVEMLCKSKTIRNLKIDDCRFTDISEVDAVLKFRAGGVSLCHK